MLVDIFRVGLHKKYTHEIIITAMSLIIHYSIMDDRNCKS